MKDLFIYRMPELVKWLEGLQKQIHDPPGFHSNSKNPLQCVITNGSQDGISKVCEYRISLTSAPYTQGSVYKVQLQALLSLFFMQLFCQGINVFCNIYFVSLCPSTPFVPIHFCGNLWMIFFAICHDMGKVITSNVIMKSIL